METSQNAPPPAATALLDAVAAKAAEGDGLSAAETVEALGDRGPAALLLILTLPALVPMPGVPAGMAVGVVIMLLALRTASGRESLRPPGWLGRRRIGRETLLACVAAARAPLARLESRMRPRLPCLAGAHMLRPLSPLVFFMGLLIALPIPFGNIAPALSLIAVALGVLTRDGAAVGVGMILAAAATLVCGGIVAVGWNWLGGA